MPYGDLNLKVPRDRYKPTMDKILQCFRRSKTLFVKAVLTGKDAEPFWRPKGENLYEIKILSIEEVPQPSGRYFRDYKLRGVLVSMNGEVGKHPKYFSWSHGGPKHEVRLFFNNYHGMSFQYGEYLTL